MHTHLQNWSTQCYSRWFAHALAPALSTARYVLPNTNVDIEPNLYLPSDPHSCPFDLSFDPYPAPPPLASHGCTSHTIGANITISSLPPKPLINPNSPDVLQIITANANTHLQNYERKKLGHTNKTDASASTITRGDTLIGNLLHRNMLLIPFVIDPLAGSARFSKTSSSANTWHHNFGYHLPDQMLPKCTINYFNTQVPKVSFS